ncbi:MAG: helix-turn-helix domain-containing protein [Oscillospiraceae bacterium]|nr:helix-turn-helix domain-containing protein [Oscillospiraceae bacterium]
MQVNVARLRGKIVERGMTQEKLARALDMDRSTFSRKMKSEALDFSVGEMHRIVEILNLNKEEAEEIFLSKNSHYCE